MFRQKSRYFGLTLLFLLTFLCPANGRAATLRVPEEFASLQAAINGAASGDTVLVAPGRYLENLKVYGKAVSIVSTDGPDTTILDGNGLDAVVSFYDTPGVPRLDGFTVTNGSRSGIAISKSNPEINNCIIANNHAWVGGGIYAQSGACPVVITNSAIVGNTAQDQGGGITANQACIQVRNTTILDNKAGRAGGGIAGAGFCGGVSVEHSRIEGNIAAYFGGGFYSSGSNRCPPGVWSTNSLVVNNVARAGGGFYQGSYGRSELRHNTVSQNLADIGGGFMGGSQSAYYKIINSIVYHNSTVPYFPAQTVFADENIVAGSNVEGGVDQDMPGSETDICADPLFVDAANGDFSLQSSSPCIDRGLTTITYADGATITVDASRTDLAGNLRLQGDGVDIGAFEFSTPPIEMQVNLTPEVVNLNSHGRWITATLTLPRRTGASRSRLIPSC